MLVGNNTIKPREFASLMHNVPDIDPRTFPIINSGARLNFRIEISNMDPSRFRIFEGDEALSVLDTLIEHFMIRKFLGPFPPDMTHWMGKEFIFSPLFTLEKTDSSELFRKYRTIFNAAAKRPKTQFQNDVVNGLYDNHPDFLKFKELAVIRTMNENMLKEEISLTSVKEIIRGMYLHDYM